MNRLVGSISNSRPATHEPASQAVQPSPATAAGLPIVGRLPSHRLGRRWLVRANPESPAKVVYLVSFPEAHREGARKDRLDGLLGLRSNHILPLERVEWEVGGEKAEGRMDPCEVRRAVSHLLLGLDDAHRHGVAHGPVLIDEALVDPRGRVLIELLGVEAARLGIRRPEIRAEVRSVVRLAVELLTGIPAGDEEGRAMGRPAGVSRAWMRWIRLGLASEGGFASAAAALAALPRT